jgi:hypothetical protein
MMARSTNPPFKGRIQKRKTNRLQIVKSSLQRTAGPYKGATIGSPAASLSQVTGATVFLASPFRPISSRRMAERIFSNRGKCR